MLPGLLIALAGLLAGVLLTWFTAVLTGQREHRNNLAYAQAGALVSRLDASIIAVSNEVNALARSPAVLALVQSPDPKSCLAHSPTSTAWWRHSCSNLDRPPRAHP